MLCPRYLAPALLPTLPSSSRPDARNSQRHISISPEVPETVGRKLGVPDRVLDVPMTEPCLQRPRVMTGIRQCIAAGVAHAGD
jgi:hypothetical protein